MSCKPGDSVTESYLGISYTPWNQEELVAHDKMRRRCGTSVDMTMARWMFYRLLNVSKGV